MSLRALLAAALAVVALGCAAPAEVRAPRVETTKTTTDIRAFAFSEPGLMAYLRAHELSSLPGYAEWLDIHPQAQKVTALFDDLRSGCDLDPFEVIEEVLFTVAGERLVGAIRVRLGEREVFACLDELVEGGSRTTIAERPALRAAGESFVFTLVDDVVLFGDETTVTERIRSHAAYAGRISPTLPDLRHLLAYARVSTDHGVIEMVESRFSRDQEGLRLSVRMRSSSTEEADWLVTAMRGALDREVMAMLESMPPERRGEAKGILRGAKVERKIGQSIEIGMPVKRLAEGQVLLTILVDRLGEAMMRRQKTEEARVILELLAMRMQAHAEDNPSFGRPSFLPSAPLNPPEPTSGSDDVPVADWTHPSWQALGFRPPMGLSHSFAIDTAAGKRSTILRAVADLDGDGELSILELELKVVGKAVVVGEVTSRGDEE